MKDCDLQIATIADTVYGVWAKYRLQITGRPPLEEVLLARNNKVGKDYSVPIWSSFSLS